MTTDHIDQAEQLCWSNLAKKCHHRDVRRIQQSVVRNEGVQTGRPVVGKMNSEIKIRVQESKRAEVSDRSAAITTRPQAEDLPTVFQDREDAEVPTRPPRTSPKPRNSSKAGESSAKDLEASTWKRRNEKVTQTKRPKGFRKELSGIAHELQELRVHMIKEEERFRLQEQIFVNNKVRSDKTRNGAPKSEGRTRSEMSKGQEEQRGRQRSPLRNQTNHSIDDLKGKVSALVKQRREMREQDRLLRMHLDEMRAQWEASVQQVEQARDEKANILNKIASIIVDDLQET